MLGGSSLGRQLGLTFGSVLGRQIALGACRDDNDDDFERRPFRPSVPLSSLPPAVDLRPWMTPVEDQGALGSCTANAIVGAMEYLAYRETGARVDLSRLFVYFNQRLWDGAVREDIGARVSDGVRVISRIGVATEASWPYQRGLFAVQPPEPVYVEAKRYVATDWWSVPVDTDAFRACLASGFPVAFGTRVTESFMRPPRSGVIPMPGANARDDARHGRHALLCAGYDDTARVFIVRNSWGPDWGDMGYCYLPYAYLSNREWTRNCWSIRLTHGEHDPAARPVVPLASMPAGPPSRGGAAGAGGAVGQVLGVGSEVAVRMFTGSGLLGGLVGGLVAGVAPGVAAGVSNLRGRDPGVLAGPDRSAQILATMRADGIAAPAQGRMPWDDGLDERAAKERATITRDVRPGAPEGRRQARSQRPELRTAPSEPPKPTPSKPVAVPPTPAIVAPAIVAPAVLGPAIAAGVTTPPKPVSAPSAGGGDGEIPEAMLRVWREAGGAAGPLGAAIPPVGLMQEGEARGLALQLKNGGIFDWDGDPAPFVLRGSDHLFEKWLATGASRSPCGWPSVAPITSGAARVLPCTRGAIVEHPRHGVYSVSGGLFARWRETGALDGPLGAPLEDAQPQSDGTTQRFEHGTLSWSPTAGGVTG